LADKFVNTGSDGKVTGRAETLAELKTMKWNTADYSDLKVTVFGDTAIATGDFKSKGTDAAGKAFDVDIRWTDTWMKMPSGKWQCIASQGTPVKA
jgi:ketosteroid isomerase-like protein